MMGARMCVRSPLPSLGQRSRFGKRGRRFSAILTATEYEKPDPCSQHDPAATRRKAVPHVRLQFTIPCLAFPCLAPIRAACRTPRLAAGGGQ
jgi:hypothetical protein